MDDASLILRKLVEAAAVATVLAPLVAPYVAARVLLAKAMKG